jgi:hypothetical protein
MDSQRLERQKPDKAIHDFTYIGYDGKNDEHEVSANLYKNRFWKSEVSDSSTICDATHL